MTPGTWRSIDVGVVVFTRNSQIGGGHGRGEGVDLRGTSNMEFGGRARLEGASSGGGLGLWMSVGMPAWKGLEPDRVRKPAGVRVWRRESQIHRLGRDEENMAHEGSNFDRNWDWRQDLGGSAMLRSTGHLTGEFRKATEANMGRETELVWSRMTSVKELEARWDPHQPQIPGRCSPGCPSLPLPVEYTGGTTLAFGCMAPQERLHRRGA